MTSAAITWSTTDEQNVALTNGNLTATSIGGSPGAVRGSLPAATGFYYWEVVKTVGPSGLFGPGLADGGIALSSIVSSSNGTVFLSLGSNSEIHINGSLYAYIASDGGDHIAICADLDRALIYFKSLSIDTLVGWNGDALWNGGSGDNPNTNTGGISLSTLFSVSRPAFAEMQFGSGATFQQVTLYPNSNGWLAAAPSGFIPPGGTFSPASDATGQIVFSNSNLTAALSAGYTGSPICLGTAAMTDGHKYYYEISFDTVTSAMSAGGADASNLYKAIYGAGSGSASATVNANGVTVGGFSQAASPSIISGLRIGICIDLVNYKFWARCVGANPAFGVGGIPIGAIASTGTFAPVAVLNSNSLPNGISAIFSATQSAFLGPIPNGATTWPGAYQPDTFVPPNIGWSLVRRVNFGTRQASLSSGRRFRAPNRECPTYKYTATFEVLPSGATNYQGAGFQAYQYAAGFYIDQQGPYLEWLFQDIYTPDYQVTLGVVGVGDGVTTEFAFCRALRNTHEPVGWVNSGDVSQVKVGGVVQNSGWSVTAPNLLTFASPPAGGAQILATFAYYWRCTFSDDTIELEEFMSQLFDLKELNFETLPSAVAANV